MLPTLYQSVRRHLTEDTNVHIHALENVIQYDSRSSRRCLVQGRQGVSKSTLEVFYSLIKINVTKYVEELQCSDILNYNKAKYT
jgi:hypothetical protein